jgi:type III secretion protein N (ATPase)
VLARGTVRGAHGGLLEVFLPGAQVGSGVRIACSSGPLSGVVVGVHDGTATIAAHGSLEGIASGNDVAADPHALMLPLGTAALGRAIDARGGALDGKGALYGHKRRAVLEAPAPGERRAITDPLWTGVPAIDALLTFGRGARIGIFGPPGAGKSTLLQSIASQCEADAFVIGLVGERGREAEEWMQRLDRDTTIVCATSDRSAAERARAAQIAMAHAQQLRSCGLHVLLILDSFARYAAALRELRVAAGESVGRGGFPAGVFADLAALVECAGATQSGSITLIATVLSDGDERDPIGDCARSLLDGHLQLSSALAQAGRFPAIDILESASRTMHAVVQPAHAAAAARVRRAIALLRQTEDARALGMTPADARTLQALAAEPDIDALLRQETGCEADRTLAMLAAVADSLE